MNGLPTVDEFGQPVDHTHPCEGGTHLLACGPGPFKPCRLDKGDIVITHQCGEECRRSGH